MSSLQHRAQSVRDTVSLQVSRDQFAQTDGRPRRNISLMRKYEAAALLPDLTISLRQHIAPAIPLFEDACCAFARGTLIQTVRGPIAIEDLLPGDYLKTAKGSEPVMWIGSTTYVPDTGDDGSSLSGLTRITSDGFGIGRPQSDLLIGPAARMVVRREKLRTLIGRDSVLVPVSDYADGDRIFNVSPGGAVQLYHLMLARHGVIEVGGMEMETYHPGQGFDATQGANMRALYLSMFPNLNQISDFGELNLSRTTREVVDSLTLN
ncbi:Hint domain-containing protein [Puniceibacterium sp. IMCC21224]|uniref:Hint domain-containing protein n=1 Tax=Puniceibacterium sp. IMCC21224 TaxID=1618204 RepID=UPI00065D9154|nr:Hint domain-containing protein [Puniceibacterium sp. IMCC21224]KMK68034.1 Hint domain [Puniceibacterium sp. IMCC21224]